MSRLQVYNILVYYYLTTKFHDLHDFFFPNQLLAVQKYKTKLKLINMFKKIITKTMISF